MHVPQSQNCNNFFVGRKRGQGRRLVLGKKKPQRTTIFGIFTLYAMNRMRIYGNWSSQNVLSQKGKPKSRGARGVSGEDVGTMATALCSPQPPFKHTHTPETWLQNILKI